MTSRNRALQAAAPVFAVTAMVLAALSLPDTRSRVALMALTTAGILLTELLLRAHHDRDAAGFLRSAVHLGVAARLGLLAVIHLTVGPYVFAPDQWTYESWGDGLLRYWNGLGPMPSALEGSRQVGFPVLNAVLTSLFGPARSAPAVVNTFLGCWVAIPVYHLSMALVRKNRGVARTAALLTLFFPSLVLWSTLNIREAPAIMAIVLAVSFGTVLQRKATTSGIIGLVLALVMLVSLREYLSVLVAAGVAAGLMMGRSRTPVRAFVVGTALLGVLTLAVQSYGLGGTLAQEPTLDLAQNLRRGFIFDANSAYGQEADISTPAGALAFLPTGLAYFLLAPFPWRITSLLQAITVPEMLIWYALIPFALWGMALSMRHDPRTFTVPLAVVSVITVAYALVEGNVGTAYRHRAQVLPIVFVFTAIGLRDVWALWSSDKAARRRRRAQAASALRPAARADAPSASSRMGPR